MATKNSMISSWKGNMLFHHQVGDHVVATDAPVAFGGNNDGAGPKALMMTALSGCSGIDVVTILQKMRVSFDEFSIEVIPELTDESPSTFSAMHLVYRFKGEGLEMSKLQRAVELSQEKYCGVAEMYRKIMKLSWEIVID